MFLLCRVRDIICALPLEHVEETMRPLTTEELAGVPPFIRGVAVIRGTPVPVIDVAILLTRTASAARRFVFMRIDDRRLALAVDDVIGVRALPLSNLDAMPTMLLHANGAVAAVETHDAALLVVLRTARVVPDEVWHAMHHPATA